jgi:hypothetical protein
MIERIPKHNHPLRSRRQPESCPRCALYITHQSSLAEHMMREMWKRFARAGRIVTGTILNSTESSP